MFWLRFFFLLMFVLSCWAVVVLPLLCGIRRGPFQIFWLMLAWVGARDWEALLIRFAPEAFGGTRFYYNTKQKIVELTLDDCPGHDADGFEEMLNCLKEVRGDG